MTKNKYKIIYDKMKEINTEINCNENADDKLFSDSEEIRNLRKIIISNTEQEINTFTLA